MAAMPLLIFSILMASISLSSAFFFLPMPPPVPAAALPVPPFLQPLLSWTNGRGDYRKMPREFLAAHNLVRSFYGTVPLRWDKGLAHLARRWSSQRRFDCTMIHSGGPFGENMFWGTGWDWRAADAVVSWASESRDYDFKSNACLPGTMCGHFTQVVWNDTRRVGCGRAECFAGGVIITCLYDPPGNFEGERPFTQNDKLYN